MSQSEVQREHQPAPKGLMELLQAHALARPEAPFITTLEHGHALSYAAAFATAQQFRGFLRARQLKSRSRIAILTSSHWSFFPLLSACASNGSSLVPINPRLHRSELRLVLDAMRPHLIITDDLSTVAAPAVADAVPLSQVLAELAGFPAPPHLDPSAQEGSPALIISTSGTSGGAVRQGVMLTEANLLSNAANLAALYQIADRDRFLSVLPLYHMNAVMMTGCVPLIAGAQVFLSASSELLEGNRLWPTVARERITICSLVPEMLSTLLRKDPQGTSEDIGSLRFVFCGAAPLSRGVWQRFEETFVDVYQGYGLTETTCWAVATPPKSPRLYDTVGIPVGCEVQIDRAALHMGMPIYGDRRTRFFQDSPAADDKRESPLGEILVRGPLIMAGYYGNPKLTKLQITEDGWLRTGDLGFINANGFLEVCGRKKEIIVKGGVTVLPDEVDSMASQHPGVQETKTIGITHPTVGEETVTVCVSKRGPQTASPGELLDFLRERLSPHNVPDRIVQMGYLPRVPAGKVAVGELRSILTGEFAERLLGRINVWKFKRAQPYDPEGVKAAIQRSLLTGEDISFVCYWGCGRRDQMAEVDRMALARLRELIAEAEYLPNVKASLTLILTDLHAISINLKPKDRVLGYYAQIQREAQSLGFKTVFLSELWSQAGVTLEEALRQAGPFAPDDPWVGIPGAEIAAKLVAQARKHFEGENEVLAARNYLVACAQDSKAVRFLFPNSIFLTYNGPDVNATLPDLPKLYIYSYKEKISDKPWFID